MLRIKFKWLVVATSAVIISLGGQAALDNYRQIQSDRVQQEQLEIQYENLESEKQQLEETIDKTKTDRDKYKKQIKEKTDLEKKLRKEIEDLKVAKAKREQRRLSLTKPAAAAPASSSSSGWHYDCRSQQGRVKAAVDQLGLSSQWTYIDHIFSHESCHDPGRLNAGGCRGLGQACPGPKLPCGPEDVICQVKWFNSYAQGKGGWAASYAFWQANHWW